ncbi:hypothetical protein [Rhodoflexus sp.]
MTINDLKTQIRQCLQESIAAGSTTIRDEFRPALLQQAQLLGLSDADLQRLISIVSKEQEAKLSKEEDIFSVDWLTEQTTEDEAALKEAEAQKLAAAEEARRLAELRAKEEAIARKKAEEEAVERHNRQIREKMHEKNGAIEPQPVSAEPPPVSAKKPTFEGKKQPSDGGNTSPFKKVLPLIIAFLVLGGGGIAAFFWYNANHATTKRRQAETRLPLLIGLNLNATDIEGIYNGTMRDGDRDESVQIEIYNLKPSVNQRFTFQFKGKRERREQNIQGPGELEFSTGSIFIAHRLMGEAIITKTDEGTINIAGANFQLAKKP